MNFIVNSTVLLKNLQAISGVLSPSSALPILDNFLFELDGNQLVVSASDLETTMSVNIELANAGETGNIAIPAKILLDTLKTFSDIPITFTINTETFGVEISAGEGKYKLAGQNSEEFPKVPVLEKTAKLEIPAEVLGKAITKTIFAAGSDELRPVMSGIYCEISTDGILFVATDAHKLVRYRRNDLKGKENAAFILPKKPLNQLKSVLAQYDTPVNIEYNQTNAAFAFGNINLVCRLIEGKYPNYEAVIPTENPNKLIVDHQALLTSIRRVSIFANQSTHQIRFKITGQELVLSAEDVDYANEAKERLTCNYTGDDVEIGFNSRFLIEMMSNVETNEVAIEMSTPNRAGLLLPVDGEEKDKEDLLMLVMPVMLNQ